MLQCKTRPISDSPDSNFLKQIVQKNQPVMKPSPKSKKPPPGCPGGGKPTYFLETEGELTRLRAPMLAHGFPFPKPETAIRGYIDALQFGRIEHVYLHMKTARPYLPERHTAVTLSPSLNGKGVFRRRVRPAG
jgi:hypothetical protein